MTRDKTLLINVQNYSQRDNLSDGVQEDLNMPLGILYLGSYLNSKGYKVKLLDTRLRNKSEFFKGLKEDLSEVVLVGLSVMTPCIGNALGITKFVKEKDPLIKVVWGGIHATLFPESTVGNEDIDFVIIKEGENALLGLAEYLLGKGIRIYNIPNLVFIENDNIIKNRNCVQEDSQSNGITNYELLDMEGYLDRSILSGHKRRQAEIITSRGCPHRCAFCVNTIVYKSRWRCERLEQTMENLDSLIERYKVDHIFFMDEDFFCNRDRVKDLIAQIAKRNITWESNCRADYINDEYIDDNFLMHIKESGCIKLRFGLESGSQRILDLLRKEITVEQSLNAIEGLTRHKIIPSVSFMMGIPGETADDVIKTVDLILRLFVINRDIDIIGPLIFRPYPGSELFEKCRKNGLVVPENLNEWSDFYIHDALEEYSKGLPWFPCAYIFRRVWLCLCYLGKKSKSKILAWPIYCVVKFHIRTKLKFIYIDYSIYKFMKKFILRKNDFA